MAITNALAGIAVKNLEAAIQWYGLILNRIPDSRPMPNLAEWQFETGGWLQVFEDAERAGKSSVTLVENDLSARRKDLGGKGITVCSAHKSDYVDTAIVKDPDGNQVVFAEAKASANRAAS